MRKLTIGLGMLAVALMAAPTVEAISTGVGHRIYFTEQVTSDTSLVRRYWSMPINSNWTAAGAFELHGDIVDNSAGLTQTSWSQHQVSGGSPEIRWSAVDPKTGYATLIVGTFLDDGPASSNAAADAYVLDIVRVTPSAGSIGYTKVGGGDGRAWSAAAGTANTDGGLMAMPDPMGAFTGDSNYILTSGSRGSNGASGASLRYKIVKDNFGDGDLTDNNADYVEGEIMRVWAENDFEIYGNRLFASTGYSLDPPGPLVQGHDGVMYVERFDNGQYSTPQAWFVSNPRNTYPQQTIPPETVPAMGGSNSGIAAGWAMDNLGVKHTAVWYGKGGTDQVWLLVDYNNDGDAFDNAEVTGQPFHEYQLIYTAASVAGSLNDVDTQTDFEFLETDNGNFLVCFSSNPVKLVVIELGDNGAYIGGDAGVAVITGLPSLGSYARIEIDYGQFPIPEPGTWLLVGTGVLGLLGYLRRRRIR